MIIFNTGDSGWKHILLYHLIKHRKEVQFPMFHPFTQISNSARETKTDKLTRLLLLAGF